MPNLTDSHDRTVDTISRVTDRTAGRLSRRTRAANPFFFFHRLPAKVGKGKNPPIFRLLSSPRDRSSIEEEFHGNGLRISVPSRPHGSPAEEEAQVSLGIPVEGITAFNFNALFNFLSSMGSGRAWWRFPSLICVFLRGISPPNFQKSGLVSILR